LLFAASGIVTRKRVAKVLDKQRKNRAKGKTSQAVEQEEEEKERRIKTAITKTPNRIPELMALETPTQICEVQTTSASQNCPDMQRSA
jgi:hypothetical protein